MKIKLTILLLVVFSFIGGMVFVSSKESKESDLVSFEEPKVLKEVALGAVVSYVEGPVEHRKGEKQWTRLHEGDTLEEGDSIETFADGRAILKLDDGSVLRLNGDSGVTFISMDPGNITVSNDKGELYSRVVKLDRSFHVISGETVYESLGTAYLTKNHKEEKGVEVFHSKVKVLDEGEEVIVEEGNMFFVAHVNEELEKALQPIPEEKKKEEFIVWNKTEDMKGFEEELGILAEVVEEEKKVIEEEVVEKEIVKEEAKEEVIPQKVVAPSGIVLSYLGNGKVSWTDYENVKEGFKVVYSKSKSPVYPPRSTDKATYVGDSNKNYAYISTFDGGGTYYIRVCEYISKDSSCGAYSNQVQATFIEEEKSAEGNVNKITVSKTSTGVSWTVDGLASKGVKVVYSKSKNPVYPPRSTDKALYVGDQKVTSHKLNAFEGEGTYYVRVCEYLDGSCGVYSNEIQTEL